VLLARGVVVIELGASWLGKGLAFPGLRSETSTPRTKTCPWGLRTWGTHSPRLGGDGIVVAGMGYAVFAGRIDGAFEQNGDGR